jgi:thymidylate kinase
MTALDVVDAAVRGRVLVTGALPPEGRDLDVLAPPSSVAAITDALRDNGFVPRRTTWARFAPFELVDVRALADEAMLARGVPLAECANACRPDPADALLLLARAFAHDGRLTASRRTRAEAPLDVWAEARARGGERELAAFADALRDGEPVVPRVARRVRRVREASVVALSGIDGAGKSTQAELLRDALAATGIDAVVEWNRLSHDRWLDALARPVKMVLRRGGAHADGAAETSAGPVPGRGVWVVVVALANALAHLRSVRAHTLAGRVVICDRYVLDSVVQLRTEYAAGRGQRLGVALVRLLSPQPRAAFYLDLPPEVAYERKPRPGKRERLERQADGYRAECARLGVVRLDATHPPQELAAEIAAETWRRI